MYAHITTTGQLFSKDSKLAFSHVVIGTDAEGNRVVSKFATSELNGKKVVSKVRKGGLTDITVEPINGGLDVSALDDAADALAEQFESDAPSPVQPARRSRSGRKAFSLQVTRKPRGADCQVSVGKVGDAWACRNESNGKVVEFATKAARDIAARVPAEWS